MTTKVIIPKSTHYLHIIKDEKLLKVIEKSSSEEDITTVIDKGTRKYLRQKHPTKVIEGQERVGNRFIDVWYNYEQN